MAALGLLLQAAAACGSASPLRLGRCYRGARGLCARLAEPDGPEEARQEDEEERPPPPGAEEQRGAMVKGEEERRPGGPRPAPNAAEGRSERRPGAEEGEGGWRRRARARGPPVRAPGRPRPRPSRDGAQGCAERASRRGAAAQVAAGGAAAGRPFVGRAERLKEGPGGAAVPGPLAGGVGPRPCGLSRARPLG